MVGRDIGTIVLKDAFLKVYLTATIEERAKRRYEELLGKGFDVAFDDVIENLKKRDLIDSSRENSPLAIALDAYVIDTTDISIQEVVEKIFLFLEGKKYALRISSRPR
jgi:cytidylate kinase